MQCKSGLLIVRAAAIYVALAFAAGFVAGVLREIVLRPLTGEIVALLVEAPVMLAVSFVAARFAIGRVMPASGRGERLAMGGVAFVLLILLELGGAFILRGLTPGAWFEQLATARGLISLALFVAFAAMPALVAKLNAPTRF